MSPTARSLAWCRKQKWTAGVVERRLPHAHTTIDLFGFVDLIVLPDNLLGGILAVQTTTGAHRADRRAKILAEPRATLWLKAGGRIGLWTWQKEGARGKRKLWTLTREEISL